MCQALGFSKNKTDMASVPLGERGAKPSQARECSRKGWWGTVGL